MIDKREEAQAREEIIGLVRSYYEAYHAGDGVFTPGDRIPYASRVYDSAEMCSLVDSALDFWLTAGRFAAQFEKGFAEFLGVKHCALVNSGSSANLLAFMALTSPLLGDRAVMPGDEVITVAASFPTTVSPIVQYGAVPVFVDVTIPQYNIDISQLENALSDKSKAVMLAHTLGNPFDIAAVKAFCEKHGLWLIEDNCDALGSTYLIGGAERLTGSFGDVGTSSFYPPHHMTMGEGARRKAVVEHLEDKGIQTRMLFAGNLVRHPCFDSMRHSGKGYRQVGNLVNTDRIMEDTFWVGVYPGMTDSMIDYMSDMIIEAVR